MSIAPDCGGAEQSFRVTHPFHPLFGRMFPLVTYRYSWGASRVYFHDDQGRLASLPAEWTSICPPAAFVQQAAGRALFCVSDLVRLADMVEFQKKEAF